MEKFRGVDYYGVDELLTEEQRMMRDAVRDWVEAKFLPVVTQHHRDGTFPIEIRKDLGEIGVFGATLKGYGCAGLDNVAYGLIMQELERGDSGLRSFASVQSGLVMYPIHAYGSDAQKDRWLPRLQSGEALGCFGLTEPDYGSDPGGMKTRAIRKGDEYVLNGTKLWITNGSVADVAVVWAKGDDGEIGGYLVENGHAGVRRARHPRQVLDARVDHLRAVLPGLPHPAARASCPASRASRARCPACPRRATASRGGRSAPRWRATTGRSSTPSTRIQFGKPIGSFQLVQQKLVWMITEITKAQLLCLRLGRLKDAGRARAQQISMAKMNNVQMALDSARLARDILGAAGIVDEHPIIRHMLNLETVNTYEGTHDIHTLIVGRDITGLDAFGAS